MPCEQIPNPYRKLRDYIKSYSDLEVDGAFTDLADQTRELLIHMGKIS